MTPARREINNEVYDTLGEGWYQADSDPIALLRAEARLRNPWVEKTILRQFDSPPYNLRILDIGCGGGFLSNYLAMRGFAVYAIDRSRPSIRVACGHDTSRRVYYQQADALALPYPDTTFDAACAMDFLEHMENPQAVIAEVSRVLRPNGLFFFYTHNRNWLSGLIVIKGVSWFVRDTPENLHLYRLFIKPAEMKQWCSDRGLRVTELRGVRPRILSSAFFGMLRTRTVPVDFEFTFARSLGVSYVGFAVK